MKGSDVFVVVLLVIVLVVGILIAIYVLSNFTGTLRNPKNINTDMPSSSSRPPSFDYTTYLKPTSPTAFDSVAFCAKLKNAIRQSVVYGKPSKVDEIEMYGPYLNSELLFPLSWNCPEDEIQMEILKGLNQTVCKYQVVTQNVTAGVTDYGGISDAAQLGFDNCVYHYDSFSTLGLGGNVIGPDPEEVNTAANTINLYYSPDYLY